MRFHCHLVVADLVGTTLEDDGAVEEALEGALGQHGLPWQPAEFARLRGRTKLDAISVMLEAQGRPADEARAVLDSFVQHLRAHYRREPLRWVEGAEAAFRQLAARGVRLALATGFPAPIRDAIAGRVPWQDCLSSFLSGDDVAHGRPAPDLVWEAMRRVGVSDPGNVAVVGDTPADVACGRAARAGLVIAVTNGACPRPLLEAAAPDLLLPSVAELPGVLL